MIVWFVSNECFLIASQEKVLKILGWLVKTCFTTKLGKLIDNYHEIENRPGSNENNINSSLILTTSIDNIYLRSPDMQMLLNLLAEKEGMWSAILILSIFDSNFKNHFKVKEVYIIIGRSHFDNCDNLFLLTN